MIITCPHCRTKYQVTYEAIGAVGRKVQCAHCQKAWQQEPAQPEDQAAFEAIAEDSLDEAMAAEERAVAAELARKVAEEQDRRAAIAKADPGRIDPAVIRRRQRDFSRRQNAMAARLPLARMRRAARISGALLLVAVLAIGYFGRALVVERYPAMAGVYDAVGLGVNVVGLDFAEVTTLRTLRDGKEVLIVSAEILGLTPEPVLVPPVVVTLLSPTGASVYEWSVTPAIRDLMAGERARFETQLALPPVDAERVRLSFAGGSGTAGTPTPAATTPAATSPAAPAPAEPHPNPEHH